MSNKVVGLQEARERLGRRAGVKAAYERWLEQIEHDHPGLIPRLLEQIADSLHCRVVPDDRSHPWVPMALVRYAKSALFRYAPALRPPPLLAEIADGEVEAWYVERTNAFEIEFRRLRTPKDTAIVRSKLTLTPWFEPRWGDTFLAVRAGPWHKPEWLIVTQVSQDVADSLIAVINVDATWSSSSAYAEDLFVLTSGERTNLVGLTGRKFITDDGMYGVDKYHWDIRPHDVERSLIRELATSGQSWRFPYELDFQTPIGALLVFDEPITEDGRTGVELLKERIKEAWNDDLERGPDFDAIFSAFGLAEGARLPDGTDAPGTPYRLLRRWRRIFLYLQLGLMDYFSVRDGMRAEFGLLKIGLGVAPRRLVDRALHDLPLRDPIRKRVTESMPGARLDDPELSIIEIERIHGIGKKSIRELLDAIMDLLMRAPLDSIE